VALFARPPFLQGLIASSTVYVQTAHEHVIEVFTGHNGYIIALKSKDASARVRVDASNFFVGGLLTNPVPPSVKAW
jgi:hypothetical protein